MPNWCANKIVYDITDARSTDFAKKLVLLKMGIKIAEEEMDDGFFSYLIPKTDPSSCNSEEWGTKWDIAVPTFAGEEEEGVPDTLEEESHGVYSHIFDTAWGPPTGFVGRLCAANPGLKVDIMFCDRAQDFLGYLTVKNEDYNTESSTFEEVAGEYPEEEYFKNVDLFDEACDLWEEQMDSKVEDYFLSYGLDPIYLGYGS